MDSAAMAELEQLQQRAMAWQVVAHADQAAADQVTQEGTQQALGNLSVSQSSAGQPGSEQQHLMQVRVPSPGRSCRLMAHVRGAAWLVVLFALLPAASSTALPAALADPQHAQPRWFACMTLHSASPHVIWPPAMLTCCPSQACP